MRIAYLTSDFGVPVLGTKGASVHVRRMVSALAARGHDLIILTPTPGEGSNEILPCPMVEIPLSDPLMLMQEELRREEPAAGNRLKKDLRNLTYSLLLEDRAGRLLDDFAPDVIYERYALFNTAGIELARRLDVPLILEVNAPLVEEQRDQRGLSLPHVARAAQRMIFERADEVIVVSRWLETYAREHGAHEGQVTVQPNAADPDLFQPLPGPSAIRKRLGWDDAIVLGFVGAMKPWHGVDTLVDALADLGAHKSPFRLLLVGHGPQLDFVQARVKELGLEDLVHFPGAVPHEEIPQWLAASDIAMVPYSAASPPYFSPVKLFECMAMGMPIVASRMGQTEEIVEHERTGWLYDSADPQEPAATLRRLADNPELWPAAGKAARDRVMAQHTWDASAQRVEQLAERAFQRRRAPGHSSRHITPTSTRGRTG